MGSWRFGCVNAPFPISTKVMPFRVGVSSRSSPSWSASNGLPPILPGFALPLLRTRRISLIAASALTANRAGSCDNDIHSVFPALMSLTFNGTSFLHRRRPPPRS
jgi:hypothetical protein